MKNVITMLYLEGNKNKILESNGQKLVPWLWKCPIFNCQIIELIILYKMLHMKLYPYQVINCCTIVTT
jgi:hypothetical protein